MQYTEIHGKIIGKISADDILKYFFLFFLKRK